MRNVLVIFEHQKHIESSVNKFIESLDKVVSVDKYSQTIITDDTHYKLIGAGKPYFYILGDKLNRLKFDDVLIHVDVVLSKNIEWSIRTMMKETKEPNNFVKEFIEFEV